MVQVEKKDQGVGIVVVVVLSSVSMYGISAFLFFFCSFIFLMVCLDAIQI